ncbi:hypothetical protein [Pseudonocardia asaccharolytica]|uniref:Uncharacterized protein n=1 Tax=Pseudonocardia asaccharolytica DSM 44247 = NBRC 16224 TaxID=1123024 RepID=A0A511DB95_9PSEU|nr:hypothetical protein [Pseudonocardia asaccharolytica]GEL20218.1 hypothetical protein PA7_40550 [Pseudonocardia asaccharolytica DSM 44247 = NBRC 16224]
MSASSNLSPAEIQSALDQFEVGIYADDYCWLKVSVLRELGPDDEQWRRGFDEMIAFAAEHGWVADGWVRVHFDSQSGDHGHR